jgi:hypothetical protein
MMLLVQVPGRVYVGQAVAKSAFPGGETAIAIFHPDFEATPCRLPFGD